MQADDKLHAASSPQDYQAAAAVLEKSVALDPHNPDTRQTLGWVYLDQLHEPVKAYPHLVRLVKMRPEDVGRPEIAGDGVLSRPAGREGPWSNFARHRSFQPDDLWIRANTGRALARTGRFSEADAIYADILKSDPNNGRWQAPGRGGGLGLAWPLSATAVPLQTLDQLATENPTNVDVLTLRGDVHRWNWDLGAADQDYQRVLDTWPDNYTAKTGLEQAQDMGDTKIGVQAYQFKDITDFLRESLEADARVHLTDRGYLIGDIAGWRFTNPGFSHLNRADGAGGVEYHFNRWLEASGEATVFQYDNSGDPAFIGGKLSTKISPMPGTDIYLNGAYNQPFVSSINTVESDMRQHSIGAGLDTRIVGPFSFQVEGQGAKLSDENKWLEVKPQLSWRVFEKPEIYLRAQYDYLDYLHFNPNYWTPQHRSTVGPVLDISLPIVKGFHIDADGKMPFVFQESRFGYQVEGGPAIDLFHHVQAKASYYYSAIPGDQGAWSGYGWQASLQVRF